MSNPHIKEWLDANVWDGEDLSGKCDNVEAAWVKHSPDDLLELVQDCVLHLLKEGADHQTKAWVSNCSDQREFWQLTNQMGTYGGLKKTKDEALALENFYEGMYDMACNARSLINKLKGV